MKTAEATKNPGSRNHPSRPAEPFFQPEKEGAFFAEAREMQTSPLQRKSAFASDGDEPLVSEMIQRKPAFESDGDESSVSETVQRKPAFESDSATVQAKPEPSKAKPLGNGLSTATSFFTTSGDGGFFSKTARPFFTPSPIQAKLTIGRPDDRYEREADEMAERVINRPDKSLSPPPPVQQQEEEETVQPALFDSITPLVQRQVDKEAVQAKPALQRQAGGPTTASADLESRLQSTKGGGQALDEDTQARMEDGFGADFSGVRIHTGSEAARMNNELGAQAFTHGSDVYFNQNKYQPNSTDGQRLLAHELTHTVQQGAVVRKKPISSTGGKRIQRGVISDLINKVLRYVPGWTLLTVIIGTNPVTGESVPRTATNLLDGLLGLHPLGTLLSNKLKESGALQEAGDWLSSELDKLGITFSYIKSLVSKAWDELSIWNSWDTNLGIVKRIFGEPYQRVKAFVGRIGDKIKEFIFRGALKMVGAPVDKIMGILNKGAAVIKTIISDPIQFFKNLAAAVGGGIKRFVGNIKQHLISGLIDWLTGAMSEVPITLPAKFDLKGIIHLVLQILGLTYDRIRAKLVKRLGEKVVAAVETGVDIVKRLITEGPMALWDMIKEKAEEIKTQVMEGIRNWVITQIVKQAVIKLLSFVNPAGALLQAVLGLYNLVMFLIENFQRIVDFVSSVFDSIGEIARGAIGKASEFIERTMARTIPIILNFLARLIGLSGIGKTVSNIIKKIRAPIDKVVDKALDFIVAQAKKLLSKGKVAVEKGVEKVKAFLFPEHRFQADDGSSHRLFVKKGAGKPVMTVESTPIPVGTFLDQFEKDHGATLSKHKKKKLAEAKAFLKSDIDPLVLKLDAAQKANKEAEAKDLQRQLLEKEVKLAKIMKSLLKKSDALAAGKLKYQIEGLTGTYKTLPQAPGDQLTPDHQPQAAILEYAATLPYFKGPEGKAMRARAKKRADAGYAINLHEVRHKDGRTYGHKGGKTKKAFIADVANETASLTDDQKKRDKVVELMKRDLAADVSRMHVVIKKGHKDPVWSDLDALNPTDKEKQELVKQIRGQIETGQGKVAAQDMDSLKGP